MRRADEKLRDNKAQRAWRAANREKVREYKRRDREKNGDKIRERMKNWYAKNHDSALARQRAYNLANADRINECTRERRAADPSKFRERARADRQKKKAAYLFYSVKARATKAGIPFDLNKEWLQDRIDAGICEMSGLPFDFETLGGHGPRNPNGASVDRIRANGGYTKDNCRLILWSINRALSNWGDEYMLHIFRTILRRRGEVVIPPVLRRIA